MQEVIEHLKLIQGVINRMAQVSFILKGWTVTLFIAMLGFAINTLSFWVGLLTLFPCIIFWILDAYYLRQERLYRCLYEKVRCDIKMENVPPLSMDTTPYSGEVDSWWCTLWRPTLCWFYGSILLITVVVVVLIYI